jgi:hypothetical protein
VKNLVYIFLVRYAERKPDEALLSINTFQKDLSDQVRPERQPMPNCGSRRESSSGRGV